MSSSAKIKLAVIRGEGVRACPFGLPMLESCKNAGDSVHRLTSLSDISDAKEQEDVRKTNEIVYAYHKTNSPCIYAENIIEQNNKVNCDFNDVGAGAKNPEVSSSPFYPTVFRGVGVDSLYSKPLGFYGDNNETRNLFLGLYSILGESKLDELIKLADKYDEANEFEKSNLIDSIINKLSVIKESNKECFTRIERHFKELTNK